jgi:hypothetical protein
MPPITANEKQIVDLTAKAFGQLKQRADGFERLMDEILRTIKTARDQAYAKCDALELRLAALEGKPSVKYVGTYVPDRAYSPGDACTDHGSLWICRTATSTRPGGDPFAWTLAAKRGRDGRDKERR